MLKVYIFTSNRANKLFSSISCGSRFLLLYLCIGFVAPMLYHQRDSTVSQVDYEVHMTRVLHAARISNVDSVTFVNRIRDMVSSELGKEIEKDVFVSSRAWEEEKNSDSP